MFVVVVDLLPQVPRQLAVAHVFLHLFELQQHDTYMRAQGGSEGRRDGGTEGRTDGRTLWHTLCAHVLTTELNVMAVPAWAIHEPSSKDRFFP